jgi:hypothetical protein
MINDSLNNNNTKMMMKRNAKERKISMLQSSGCHSLETTDVLATLVAIWRKSYAFPRCKGTCSELTPHFFVEGKEEVACGHSA